MAQISQMCTAESKGREPLRIRSSSLPLLPPGYGSSAPSAPSADNTPQCLVGEKGVLQEEASDRAIGCSPIGAAATAGCAPHERIVRIPRVLSARVDIE